jgi:pimeloyl-ACP methyl ester carboxylesterase
MVYYIELYLRRQFININLYYKEKGKGEVLVLLHGNSDNSNYFVNQIEYFKDQYRVIAIDTRGHGKSPRGDMPFTISQFADDLNNFLNKLNIDKITLLGFSDGANIGMKFALKYPEKLNALILDGGNLNKEVSKFLVKKGY